MLVWGGRRNVANNNATYYEDIGNTVGINGGGDDFSCALLSPKLQFKRKSFFKKAILRHKSLNAFSSTLQKFRRKEVESTISHYADNKIQTRQYFGGNIMLNPGYTHLMDSEKVVRDYPNARKVTTDTFFLGTSPVITNEQIDYTLLGE